MTWAGSIPGSRSFGIHHHGSGPAEFENVPVGPVRSQQGETHRLAGALPPGSACPSSC